METIKTFFGLHYRPKLIAVLLLGAIPFVMLILAYTSELQERRAINKSDRILPTLTEMYDQVTIYMFKPDIRTGAPLFLHDLKASMSLMGIGLLIAAISSFVIGILMGVFPWFRALTMPMVIVFSIIPPLSILAILFCVFGTGDMAKIAIIVIGTSFLMMRDVVAYIRSLPVEQMVKTLTLGHGAIGFLGRVVAPQVFPRFLEILRLNLGPAWLFLIAAEGLAADAGLAHRMYMAQRTNLMALVIPNVMIITIIAVLLNLACLLPSRVIFKWHWLSLK